MSGLRLISGGAAGGAQAVYGGPTAAPGIGQDPAVSSGTAKVTGRSFQELLRGMTDEMRLAANFNTGVQGEPPARLGQMADHIDQTASQMDQGGRLTFGLG